MYMSKFRQTHEVPSMGPSTKWGYRDIVINGLCMPRILGTIAEGLMNLKMLKDMDRSREEIMQNVLCPHLRSS